MNMNVNQMYGSAARFDGARQVLTEDALRKLAPSIFATDAHESRSARFAPIPTFEVLKGLMREGFMPVGAKQSRSRDKGRRDFTKHLIRLRRMDDDQKFSVGDTVCEVLLKNANDGTSAYELMAGLFRIRCLNSLVAQTATLESTKVRHSGDVAANVIEGTFTVLQSAQRALAAPADWGTVTLDRDERHALAEAAHVLRFGDAEGEVATPIKPEQLLIPRRVDDRFNDLWTTWNVAQENVIRGGLTAIGTDAEGRRRRTTTREVKGIDQDVKLNRALWVLGQRMAELKGIKTAA
jgi:hypothetical protein